MPTFTEVRQYLGGQVFGNPILPQVDLTGKVYIITGGNTGLGFECAKHLAQFKASKIILGCRNLSKGEAAKKIILKQSPPTTIVESIFSSVFSFAHRIRSLDRLDGLVANAGLGTVIFESSEGYENMLTVNIISTSLLAILALPKLKETAAKIGTRTNLEIVGLMQHVFAPSEQLLVPAEKKILDVLSDEKTANMQKRYELSKLMVQLCGKEVAEKVDAGRSKGEVVVNCVNPGWCATELSRYYDKGRIVGFIFRMIGRTAEAGGRTLVHGVTAGKETHGKYLSECEVKTEGDFVRSEQGRTTRKRLWQEVGEVIERVAPGALPVLN